MRRAIFLPARGRGDHRRHPRVTLWILCGLLSLLAVLAVPSARAAEDFGDAPDSYQTLLNSNGARHTVVTGIHLGPFVDAEPDGQPSAGANADDINPVTAGDDENGVFLPPTGVSPGATVPVTVVASTSGLLNAWLDMAGDGTFVEKEDQIFANTPLAPGTNNLSFVMPAVAEAGITTYARFRFAQQADLTYEGPAQNGEVEDYTVAIVGEQQPLDYGDAPDSYQTKAVSNGARHMGVQGFWLGNIIDLELDGQPSTDALGDDVMPSTAPDDEDGVVFMTALSPGQPATIGVQASISGFLDAWFDFDGDGTFAQANNQVFASRPVSTGANTLNFVVPPATKLGQSYARFRFSRDGGLSWFGPAGEGEVEDYQVEFVPPQIPCEGNSKGTDFWVTFPGNYAPDADNPLKLRLCIVGVRLTEGTVSIPGLGWSTNFVIPASMEVTIPLPEEADLGDVLDGVQDNGVHVQANAPVAVFGLSRVLYTTDGFTALPSVFLGKEYVIQSYGNVHAGVPSLNGTQFGIVACDDATQVTITPNRDVGEHPAGVPYMITLNRGQTYQLRNTNDVPADLSGTLVVGDKPIGVFGSHRCANIPDENTWFCDYIVEQQLPVERGGQNFLTMPLATRTGGDIFRIFSVQDGTAVVINGAFVATLNKGEFHQAKLTGPSFITADGRALVMQYSQSSDADLVTDSDPFELVVPSTDLFDNQYMVCVPDAGYVSHYLNVIAPNAAVGTILLDGGAIPAGLFVPIGATGFSGAQVPVTPGAHNVVSPGNGPAFGLSVYGWAEFDSYGYPGGYYFRDRTPPTLTCLETNVTVVVDQECVGIIPDLTQLVTWDDNCDPSPNSVVRQTPPPGAQVPVGVYPVTLSVTDAAGNTGSCVITVTIEDAGVPMIFCPQAVTANCDSDEGAKVDYQVTARTFCGADIMVVCDPPPGSIFPPGNTVVSCTATTASGQTASCNFVVTVRCLDITLTPQPGSVVVTWTGGGTLQTTDDPAGQWSDLSGVRSPATLQSTGQAMFFKVRYE